MSLKVFTIDHSNWSLDAFRAILKSQMEKSLPVAQPTLPVPGADEEE